MEVVNKKAKFDYFILESETAGIILMGSELRPLRTGKVSITEAFIWINIDKNEVWIKNMYIKNELNSAYTHEELRDRKLLLTKKQIKKWGKELINKGITVIPLRGFFDAKNKFKLDIALAKGKNNPDKRNSIKEKDIQRELLSIYKNI